MFKLLKDYAETTEPSYGKENPSFIYAISINEGVNLVKRFLEENNYTDIKVDDYYNDVFAKKDGYEISFLITKRNENTMISYSLYSKANKGKVKTRFEIIYLELEEFFEKI